VAIDEAHLLTAVRYVLLDPVRARLVTGLPMAPVERARAARRLRRRADDGGARARPLRRLCRLIEEPTDQEGLRALRRAAGIGRPLGYDGFGRHGQTIDPRHAPARHAWLETASPAAGARLNALSPELQIECTVTVIP
jgi:hypothetical protein